MGSIPASRSLHMDVVIPFKNSINQDEELIYTLRSFEKFFSGVGQVFVVGDKPKWAGHYIHIPYPDHYPQVIFRDRNMVNKLLVACADERVPETFLYAHDDQAITAPCDVDIWPYHHCGRSWTGAGDYWNVENNTKELFPRCNNYDLHCPAIMTKSGAQLLKTLDWSVPYGYCIKTAYAVLNHVEGEFYTDLKLKAKYSYEEVCNLVNAGRRFFSFSDAAWRPGVRQWLQERFPNKSKYEL